MKECQVAGPAKFGILSVCSSSCLCAGGKGVEKQTSQFQIPKQGAGLIRTLGNGYKFCLWMYQQNCFHAE